MNGYRWQLNTWPISITRRSHWGVIFSRLGQRPTKRWWLEGHINEIDQALVKLLAVPWINYCCRDLHCCWKNTILLFYLLLLFLLLLPLHLLHLRHHLLVLVLLFFLALLLLMLLSSSSLLVLLLFITHQPNSQREKYGLTYILRHKYLHTETYKCSHLFAKITHLLLYPK